MRQKFNSESWIKTTVKGLHNHEGE
jgi:hypothetical protein